MGETYHVSIIEVAWLITPIKFFDERRTARS